MAGNFYAAISFDSGNSFSLLSPYDMVKANGEIFCCDQRLLYIPSIDHFVWVLLSSPESGGSITLAVQSPGELEGMNWVIYKLNLQANLNIANATFDFPQTSFGSQSLYLTADVVGGPGGALVIRIPLANLQRHESLQMTYFHTPEQFVCPVQSPPGAVGFFGTLSTESNLRLYAMVENSNAYNLKDIPIATVPTTDFSISIPNSSDEWLPVNSKIQSNITGAACSGNQLWFAWSAGRKFNNGQNSNFPQPHIELAVIDLSTLGLNHQRYIWNPDFGFAWPSLAANTDNPAAIGMSFDYGGGSLFPQHAVGTVFPAESFVATTAKSGSFGAGGHYNDIRMNFPETNQFVTGGFVGAPNNLNPPVNTNQPHYVVFGP
jgi:hypothetical protein